MLLVLQPDALVPAQAAVPSHASPLLERRRRPPVDALAGGTEPPHLAVQLVDLLERQALGLVDEEVDEGDAEEAAAEPDEEDLGLQVGVPGPVVDEVGRRVGDGPVEKPLRGKWLAGGAVLKGVGEEDGI